MDCKEDEERAGLFVPYSKKVITKNQKLSWRNVLISRYRQVAYPFCRG